MTEVKFAGVCAGQEEIDATMKVVGSPWLAAGKEADLFEKEFAEKIGVEYGLVVNSGSSANLLALASLNLPKGAKVITCGGGFPATLNPILHLGLTPLLTDIDFKTGNINLEQVEILAPQAQAIIFAHTLGLPVDMNRLISIANRYNLKVIEDCCEAIGTKFNGKYVGSFGDVGTYSFYPSHQMTALGGGGMMVTNDKKIAMRAKSLREWGKRQKDPSFEGDATTVLNEEVAGVPYTQSYVYDTVGFNMKYPEANCAYGRVQLKKLDQMNEKRKENYSYLKELLKDVEHFTPEIIENADPAYFGYLLIMNDMRTRGKLITYLEKNGVRVRPWFAGNICYQPAFRDREYEGVSQGENAFTYMQRGFFVGVWAGLDKKDMEYISKVIHEGLDDIASNR